jgi:hypothetical protein
MTEKTSSLLYSGKVVYSHYTHRGFKPDKDYLGRYRFKPCSALLSFIYDRVSTFDYYTFQLDCKRQQIAVEELTKAGILVPGNKIKNRGFW